MRKQFIKKYIYIIYYERPIQNTPTYRLGANEQASRTTGGEGEKEQNASQGGKLVGCVPRSLPSFHAVPSVARLNGCSTGPPSGEHGS